MQCGRGSVGVCASHIPRESAGPWNAAAAPSKAARAPLSVLGPPCLGYVQKAVGRTRPLAVARTGPGVCAGSVDRTRPGKPRSAAGAPGGAAVPPCTARPVPPRGAGRQGPATHPSIGLAPPPALVAAHAAVDLHHVAFPQRELPHVPGRKVVPGHRRADDTGREHCGGRRGRHAAATCCGAVQPGSRAGGRAVLLMRGATTGRSAPLGTGRCVSRGQEGECSRGQEQMPALRRSQPLRGLPAPGARVSRGQWVAGPSSL